MLTTSKPISPAATVPNLAVELHVTPKFPPGPGSVGASAIARLTRYGVDSTGTPQPYGQPIVLGVPDVFADSDANDQALLATIYGSLQTWITAEGL